MKKIILLLVLSLSINAFAQNEVKEGILTGKMTMSSDNEQVAAQLAMVGEMKIVTYFNETKTRTEMGSPMTGDNTSILDLDSNKMLALMDNPMMGKKYVESKIDLNKEDLSKINVEPTGASKTFLGYDCKEYKVEMEKDGQVMKMNMYVTDKLIVPTQNTVKIMDKIKGTPLYMVMEVNQMGMPMKVTMEITEVKAEKVDTSKFDMKVPEGYTEMVK